MFLSLDSRARVCLATCTLASLLCVLPSRADDVTAIKPHEDVAKVVGKFDRNVQPILETYCYDCHGRGESEGSVALDKLNPDMFEGPDAESWHAVLNVLNHGAMPPGEEDQPSEDERHVLVDWIMESLDQAAAARQSQPARALRRLTKEQYSNTLAELLHLPIRFGDVLPDDGKSKTGFSNNGEVLQISPLHIEYYQAIARNALNKAIVTGERPNVIRYKVSFGENIGQNLPGAQYKGYQTVPVNSDDFCIDILDSDGANMESTSRSVERSMNEVKNNIGVGLRGSSNDRFGVVKDGMVLYSALPHKNVPPRSWQGPSPNLKLVIKNDYPQSGAVRFRVNASRGRALETRMGLIGLREQQPALATADSIRLLAKDSPSNSNLQLNDKVGLLPIEVAEFSSASLTLAIPTTGYYQLDLVHPYAPEDSMPSFRLNIDGFGRVQERLHLDESLKGQHRIVTPVSLAYFKKGEYSISLGGKFFIGFSELLVTPLPDDNAMSRRLAREALVNQVRYAGKNPSIRVFAGTRTDDGMDFATFDVSKEVTAEPGQSQMLEFVGRLENLPIPVFDPKATTVHANTMVIGLWNNYLVKQSSDSGPPLLVHSVEIEAPYYPVWPPKSHTEIFFDSSNFGDEESYTREVLTRFIERAYRRPLHEKELDRYMNFWLELRGDHKKYEDSIKEVLVSVLCNPNFLFLAHATGSDGEQYSDEFALASRLSYFLWNSPPDEELIELARNGRLREELPRQIDRMVADQKIWRMIRPFTYEWLRIDRQQFMDTDVSKFPDFTRFVKEDMPEETYRFVHHVLTNNLSILNFIQSNFAMLNQNLAEFYGVAGVEGDTFQPVSVTTDQHRGGLLAQGAFLNGHSDGAEPHSIKRAVWLKEKILGDPSPPPPPNVPELDPEAPGFEDLTLKEQLELHRDKASCVDCHKKIDPYGIVFENLDAVGRFREQANNLPVDAISVLPDGTEVNGLEGIQEYILNNRTRDVTKALVEHVFAYALGRDVTFADENEIQRIVDQVVSDDYRFRSLIKNIVLSGSFLDD